METWVIKDTAPVDAASRELAAQPCSFVSYGTSFSSISVGDPSGGGVCILVYGDYEVAGAEYGLGDYDFSFDDDAYRTLVFDVAPAGDLLAWLQKNADKQVVDYLTTDADLKAVADAIRAKGGTSAPLTYPDGFVSAIGAISSGNYRRFEGTIESTVTGSGTSVLLVEDEIIGQVSELDSLLVRLSTDFAGDDAYTLLGCTAANALRVISTDNYQFLHRIGATAGVYDDRNAGNKPIATTRMSVGQLIIRGNQLKWYVGSANYAARPCNYVVEVMW